MCCLIYILWLDLSVCIEEFLNSIIFVELVEKLDVKEVVLC